MAVKVNAGDDLKRGDIFFVNPFEIEVREENRGRQFPPTEEEIIELALSMFDKGNIEPVECRKFDDNRLMLTLGFTRMAAARLIRKGFKDSEGNEFCDAKFKLKVTLAPDLNDEKALLRNIAENLRRHQLSIIDHAYNHARLRDRYGWSDADIAREYKWDPSRVSKIRKLLTLPSDVQKMVHFGKMPQQAAFDLLDLPEEQRKEVMTQVVEEARNNGQEKIDASKLRTQVRARILADDTEEAQADNSVESPKSTGKGEAKPEGKKKGAAKPLSLREIRKFYEDLAENHPDEAVQTFAKTSVQWINGRRRQEKMAEAVDALLDAERS